MASHMNYGRTEKAGTAQHRAGRCRFSRSICGSNFALSCALKEKRRLKEAVRLIVTHGAGLEESRNSCFAQRTASTQRSGLHLADVQHIAFHTTDMFCMALRNCLNWCIKHSGFFMGPSQKLR